MSDIPQRFAGMMERFEQQFQSGISLCLTFHPEMEQACLLLLNIKVSIRHQPVSDIPLYSQASVITPTTGFNQASACV